MLADIIIYHNGVCSKCHGALELLQARHIAHTVRWYLADPLSEAELRALLHKLGMQASQLVRTTEPLYAEQYAGKNISEAEWLTILAANPILMQRPIIEKGSRAIVARPPERVLEMIGE